MDSVPGSAARTVSAACAWGKRSANVSVALPRRAGSAAFGLAKSQSPSELAMLEIGSMGFVDSGSDRVGSRTLADDIDRHVSIRKAWTKRGGASEAVM